VTERALAIERRYAVLIGNSQFASDSGLVSLQCPVADVDGMNEILVAEDLGGFSEPVICKNLPHYEVESHIDEVFHRANRNDLVLLYYSGHGCVDVSGQLYLATANTRKSSLIPTSLSVERIRSIIRNRPLATKVVIILDCCYSGRVERAFLRGGVDEQLRRIQGSSGTYILTASTGIQAAQEKEGDQYGLLTKHIIAGIRSGEAANEDGLVTMETLYNYVFAKVCAEGPQEPMMWEFGVRGDDLVIAKSRLHFAQDWGGRVSRRLHELKENLPPRIYEQAKEIALSNLEDLPPEQRGFAALLDELVTKRIAPGVFIDEWYEARNSNDTSDSTEKVETSRHLLVERTDTPPPGAEPIEPPPSVDIPANSEGPPPSYESLFDLPSSKSEIYFTELSREKAARLEAIRETYRQGKRHEAYEQMKLFRANPSWDELEKPLQSLALRALGVMTLGVEMPEDLTEVRRLVEEAARLDPEGSTSSSLPALLRYYSEGPKAALEEVANPTTVEAFNLHVGFLLEINSIQAALAMLRNPPPQIEFDAETRKLLALALLAEGNLEESRLQIEEAKREQPKWQGIRDTAARIDYYTTLSPMALPQYLVVWPVAIHSSLVKQDDDSLRLLRRSESEFRLLAADSESESHLQNVFEVWRLACLANHPQRKAEANEFCRELLQKNPGNPPVLAWALARGFEIDLPNNERALELILGEDVDDE
jgi:hypothetical protein